MILDITIQHIKLSLDDVNNTQQNPTQIIKKIDMNINIQNNQNHSFYPTIEFQCALLQWSVSLNLTLSKVWGNILLDVSEVKFFDYIMMQKDPAVACNKFQVYDMTSFRCVNIFLFLTLFSELHFIRRLMTMVLKILKCNSKY